MLITIFVIRTHKNSLGTNLRAFKGPKSPTHAQIWSKTIKFVIWSCYISINRKFDPDNDFSLKKKLGTVLQARFWTIVTTSRSSIICPNMVRKNKEIFKTYQSIVNLITLIMKSSYTTDTLNAVTNSIEVYIMPFKPILFL